MKWTSDLIRDWLTDHHKSFSLVTTDMPTRPSTQKLQWRCDVCAHEWLACFDQIRTSHSGCPSCAKNAPYTVTTLSQRLIDSGRADILVVSIDPSRTSRSLGKFAEFQCTKCLNKWRANIHNVVKFGYGCPDCNSNIGSPCVSGDHKFHSKLERYFWERLTPATQAVTERQRRYMADRRLTCDFVINMPHTTPIWVEISGEALLKRLSYSKTLRDKQTIVLAKGHEFVILSTIPQINQFINMRNL